MVAMNQAQSSRAVLIYLAKREMLSWQFEYRRAKADLNGYKTPACRSMAWWMFNVSRDRYLKSMAALRSALKTPKGE
jgi:hypothetical protein